MNIVKESKRKKGGEKGERMKKKCWSHSVLSLAKVIASL